MIIGLGNPGQKYEMTRHNMGYLVAKMFARTEGWNFKEEKKFNSFVAKGKIGEVTVAVLLPTTYMNESGLAARRYLDFYRLTPSDIIVVSDEVAIPFGVMRLREAGSAGGHNGLKSVEAHLGTDRYLRLRMGIHTDLQRETLADYVLDAFSQKELVELTQFIEKGAQVLKRLLMGDPVSIIMSGVNPKKLGEK